MENESDEIRIFFHAKKSQIVQDIADGLCENQDDLNKRNTRIKRDHPLSPVSPSASYMFFCQEKKLSFIEGHKLWSECKKNGQLKKYDDMAKADVIRYNNDIIDHENLLGIKKGSGFF